MSRPPRPRRGRRRPAPRGAGSTPAWLTAETLRRAKFDHPESAAPLLRAVHDLLLVAIAGFPDARVAAETLDAIDAGDRTTPGDRSKRHAAFVTAHLRAMGYPRVATLLRGAEARGGGAIREDEEGEGEDEDEASDATKRERRSPPRERSPRSRPLLFALAWLVRECDVFARAHADECAAALEEEEEEGFTAGTLRPPYPPDSASAQARAAAGGARARSAPSSPPPPPRGERERRREEEETLASRAVVKHRRRSRRAPPRSSSPYKKPTATRRFCCWRRRRGFWLRGCTTTSPRWRLSSARARFGGTASSATSGAGR